MEIAQGASSTKQGGDRCTFQLFTVLSLRHFTDQSRMAEQNLVELGQPNEFFKEPLVVTRETWRSVQMMAYATFKFCDQDIGMA